MKKLFLSLLLAFGAVSGLNAAGEEETKFIVDLATNPTIKFKKLTLRVGQTLRTSHKTTGFVMHPQYITMHPQGIVSVSTDGTIKALNPGATFVAETTGGKDKKHWFNHYTEIIVIPK